MFHRPILRLVWHWKISPAGYAHYSGNKVAWLFGPRRRALVLGRGREKVVDGQQAVVTDMLWRRRATATWRLVERALAHCAWSRRSPGGIFYRGILLAGLEDS